MLSAIQHCVLQSNIVIWSSIIVPPNVNTSCVTTFSCGTAVLKAVQIRSDLPDTQDGILLVVTLNPSRGNPRRTVDAHATPPGASCPLVSSITLLTFPRCWFLLLSSDLIHSPFSPLPLFLVVHTSALLSSLFTRSTQDLCVDAAY